MLAPSASRNQGHGDGDGVGETGDPEGDSVDVGIRHLERLYLELGALRVELEDSPVIGGVTSRPQVERSGSAD